MAKKNPGRICKNFIVILIVDSLIHGNTQSVIELGEQIDLILCLAFCMITVYFSIISKYRDSLIFIIIMRWY